MNQTPSKNDRKVNKILYILTVTLLFAIAVVIAITSAANRRNEKTPGVGDESTQNGQQTILKEPEKTSPPESEKEDPKPPVSNETEGPKESEAPETNPTAIAPSDLMLPVNGVLSKKHDLTLQVYSATMDDYRVHSGIDIVTSDGAPVYAAADGIVSQVWSDPLMGSCIAVKHQGDFYTVYKNLSAEHAEGIEEGASVVSGQMISSVGGSAMIEIAEEPHLHFEVMAEGKSVDPLDYFDNAELTSLSADNSYES